MDIIAYMFLGLLVGALSGMLGVGGGILMIPALVFLAGYTQKEAQGISLAVMLPPVGAFAVMQYHRQGLIDWRPALCMIPFFAVGALLVAKNIKGIPDAILHRTFGVLLAFVAGQMLLKDAAGWASGLLWGGAGVAAAAGGGMLKHHTSARATSPVEETPVVDDPVTASPTEDESRQDR